MQIFESYDSINCGVNNLAVCRVWNGTELVKAFTSKRSMSNARRRAQKFIDKTSTDTVKLSIN